MTQFVCLCVCLVVLTVATARIVAAQEGAVHLDRGEFAHGSILLTEQDVKMQHNAALHAFSRANVGGTVTWINPTSGNSGSISPTLEYMVGDVPCRNVTVTSRIYALANLCRYT